MVAGRLRWREPNAKSPGKIGLASSHFAKRKSHVKTRANRSALFQRVRKRYSDEILHGAKLSPLAHTQRRNGEEIERLFDATRMTLREWTDRLRRDTGEKFPDKVTAFRPDMAVHGRFGLPWPVCVSPVQRIVYVDNETHYCARCQTGGVILAERALSRLLKKSWPRALEHIE